MSGKSVSSTAAEQCLKSAVKQLKGLLKKAEAGEEVNMAAVKELTAVMKELVKLRQAMAEEKETAQGPVVEVVWGEGVEALAN